MSGFTDLPSELIESIALKLPLPSIRSLQVTSKHLNSLIANSATIQHHIFQLHYSDNKLSHTWNHPHPDWHQLMRSRRSAHVKTCGALTGGRLGFTASLLLSQDSSSPLPLPLPQRHSQHLTRRGFNQGVTHFVPIPALKCPVRAVSAGGFSFQILSVNGQLYTTGTSWHYGHSTAMGPSNGEDYNELLERAREEERRAEFRNSLRFGSGVTRNGRGRRGERVSPLLWPGGLGLGLAVPGRITVPGYSFLPDDVDNGEINGNPHVRKCGVIGGGGGNDDDDDVKFVSVDSGRAHFVALSDKGVVYSFDSAPFGIPLEFKVQRGEGSTSLEKNVVVKRVKAGWNYNLVEFQGLGLAVWRSREALKEGQVSSVARVEFITPDNVSVVDFIGLENHVIFIDKAGSVWSHDLGNRLTSELLDIQATLKELNKTSVQYPKAIRLAGSFKTFAVFSNIDICLLKEVDSVHIQIIPELNGTGCVDVQIGDYHLMALLASGKVLSWGLESKCCGCLGLGSHDEVVARGEDIFVNLRREVGGGTSMRVERPIEVIIEGKAVGIACGGWQSCAIVI